MRSRWLAGTAAIVLAIPVVSACDKSDAPAHNASPPVTVSLPDKPMSAEAAAAVEKTVSALQAANATEAPAVLVGVWDPAKGFYTGVFGKSEAASAADTVRIGSITKTFVATLVLQLVAEGRLTLDGTVGQYVPELATRYPEVGSRTVEQLLSMRSGLPDYAAAVTGRIASEPALTSKAWTADELIKDALADGPVGPAGATPASYSNTNYIVLGEILEKVTGMSLPDLVSARLLKPLALNRTAYPPAGDTRLAAPASHGYVMAGGVGELTVAGGTFRAGTDVSDWTASWGGAAGIMSSTVGDLARWAATGFGSATLPESLRTARAKSVRLEHLGEYGLGLQKLGAWSGHMGGVPGWSTVALRNTTSGAIVVVAVDACCGDTSSVLPLRVVDALYPGTLSLT
ncbi:serine hydrolase domain-containing protein [Actinoplanes sp. NPDC049596]|uniref:serine hydrolase domain-containing protein n=1 Tax=unclassified Actinoplanes TaxID=2626549 RepID=UPI00344080D2